MTPCTYTRKVPQGYEFGYITLENTAMKNEKRTYVPLGIKPTIDEALIANQMALKGEPRLGSQYSAPLIWSELYAPVLNPIVELQS